MLSMESVVSITKETRVNDIFKSYPETLRVFLKYDIPACCPLDTLEVEAKKRGIDPDKLLKDVIRVVKKG